ncbi:MAG: flagellar basal body L-ring protein FlgH [Bryobacteraceae bacterium]
MLAGVMIGFLPAADHRRAKSGGETALDRLIRESQQKSGTQEEASSPGSLYAGGGRLADLARDLRASQVHDLVTIVVADRASAVSKGSTTSARKAESRAGVSALAGPLRASGPLAQLANFGGQSKLDGQGETSRQSVLETTISARVIHVLPNGNLIVEGSKDVMINSERQKVTIRGVVRWNDLSPNNRVSSDRLSDLEVRVEGRGVVQDAIRRPNFLFRLLNGLLPF